jgi:hypothetical protein
LPKTCVQLKLPLRTMPTTALNAFGVAGCESGVPTRALDFFADGFEWFGPAAHDEEARAEAGEMQSHGAAQAGTASGEEDPFGFQ